jgi:hypothetical protein
MTVVIGELRLQINTVQNNLVLAEQGGLSHEADLQRARLHNLVGVAALLHIDVTAGVDRSPPRPRPMAAGVRHGGSQPASTPLLDLAQLLPAPGAHDARPATARRAALSRRPPLVPAGGPRIAVNTAQCWMPRTDPAQREVPRAPHMDATHIEVDTTWTS